MSLHTSLFARYDHVPLLDLERLRWIVRGDARGPAVPPGGPRQGHRVLPQRHALAPRILLISGGSASRPRSRGRHLRGAPAFVLARLPWPGGGRHVSPRVPATSEAAGLHRQRTTFASRADSSSSRSIPVSLRRARDATQARSAPPARIQSRTPRFPHAPRRGAPPGPPPPPTSPPPPIRSPTAPPPVRRRCAGSGSISLFLYFFGRTFASVGNP